MHGAGTKANITKNSPAARLLDLSRLISRVGRGPFTGVDRVELAYLRALLVAPVPLFTLIRLSGGYVVLDETKTKALLRRFLGEVSWGKADLRARLRRKQSHLQRRAQSDCRRLAVARSRRIADVLRALPSEFSYLNVGHSNLRVEVMEAVKRNGGRINVLVHDLIPLDYPAFQREGTVTAFEQRMRCVAKYADLVIYNSEQSQRDGARHFESFGRVPDGIVALLGVSTSEISQEAIPREVDKNRPYFVTLGTIEPRKNHALLLDVWDGFATDPTAPQLIIIGARGWENTDVFARLDAHPHHVVELNDVSDGVAAQLVSGAAGLLFPSFAEGFGLPPAEATALGTPVVCGDLPVYREFLGDIPIYADTEDRYLWEQQVQLLLARDRAEQSAVIATHQLPNWEDHFNKVLRTV
jgi:glycosyltransferase involved in cell wall biosynthesis